jgi:hypothetical protein
VDARAEGAQDVAAIKLRDWKQIERGGEEADPRGSTDGGKQQQACIDAGVKERVQKTKDERRAENKIGVSGIGETENNLRMKDPVNERWYGECKAYKRARGADIEESAIGANGRADEDEGAKGADEGWEGNEEGIAGADVMITAGKEVAEFVDEENSEEREGERKSGGECGGLAIEESEVVKKLIDRGGLSMSERDGELCACDEAGAHGEKKERDGERERSVGRPASDKGIARRAGRDGGPVDLGR